MKKILFIPLPGMEQELFQEIERIATIAKQCHPPICLEVFANDSDEEKILLFEKIMVTKPDAVVLGLGPAVASDEDEKCDPFFDWYDAVRDALGLYDLDRKSVFSIGTPPEGCRVTQLAEPSAILNIFSCETEKVAL